MTKIQRDISLTLIVKLCLLAILWYVCFSGPRHKHDIYQLLFDSSVSQTAFVTQ